MALKISDIPEFLLFQCRGKNFMIYYNTNIKINIYISKTGFNQKPGKQGLEL